MHVLITTDQAPEGWAMYFYDVFEADELVKVDEWRVQGDAVAGG